MVRDACMIIVTVTMVGLAGYLITSDVRQRRELDAFRVRLAERMAGPRWRAVPVEAELEEGYL
jgi:hypothetical protein